VEAAASAQRLHCLPHSLIHLHVHRSVVRSCRQGHMSPQAPLQFPLRSAWVWPQMQKSHSPETGKRLLNVRTLCGPSYGVEATSRELSLGMPPICTSDMAAHGRPRELPPSAQPHTWRITVCTLMTNQVYGTRRVLRNARGAILPRFPKSSSSRYLTADGGASGCQGVVSARRARSSGFTTLPVGLRGRASTKTN